MTMDFSNVSLLLVAGGRSSRMHEDKRRLMLNGAGLLELMLSKAAANGFSEILLCVEERLPFIVELASKFRAEVLIDHVEGGGPMVGIVNGLKRLKTDWALVVSCDMPFFDFGALENIFDGSSEIIVPRAGGRLQTLAAFYRRSTVDSFEQSLSVGERKLRAVIERVPHRIVDVGDEIMFFNVNTRADMRLARGRAINLERRVPIISIVAPKSGTGKTTFIERLIPKLIELNIRVGVVKSDAHSFNLDVEGKDSYRFQRSGAASVAVVSPGGWFMINRTKERAEFDQIVNRMTDIDLILTESRTHGTLPSISLYRGLDEPLINDDVVALFTDRHVDCEIEQFDLDDVDAAVKLCRFLCEGGRSL